MSWHADPELARAYVDGSLDPARSASLESHLLSCALCRAELALAAPRPDDDPTWVAIEARLDALPGRPVERVLAMLGVPDHVARLLAATPSLTLSWFLAVAVALGFAALAARAGSGGLLLFLIVAPLVPLLGVAVAYGPGIDPTYEVGLAAPMRSSRLLLLRAIAVLSTSTAIAGLAALALPDPHWAAAWLLPSLGLTLAALALSTFVRPLVACGVLAGAWIAGVVVAEWASAVPVAAFRTPGQAGFALVALLSAAVLGWRRGALETRRHA